MQQQELSLDWSLYDAWDLITVFLTASPILLSLLPNDMLIYNVTKRLPTCLNLSSLNTCRQWHLACNATPCCAAQRLTPASPALKAGLLRTAQSLRMLKSVPLSSPALHGRSTGLWQKQRSKQVRQRLQRC